MIATHIKEVDEHIDYEHYWTFPPQTTNLTKAAGNRFWKDIEGLADHYPCPPCKPGAQALAHGGHDTVNLLLGKSAQTPKQFEMLVQMVKEADRRYHSSKHCTGGNCKRASHIG